MRISIGNHALAGAVGVRVMFANFAKIGRAAGASPIWQNFQTSRVNHEKIFKHQCKQHIPFLPDF